MPKVQHSTANGVPDHHYEPAVQGVISGVAPHNPSMPPPPTGQRPPHYGGVELPLDPILAAAGVFWNEDRELVRTWRIHDGPPESVYNAAGVVVKKIQRYRTHQRLVAPPGMPLEQARAMGLDFYSPQLGWIRAGVKRETDSPENLGTGHLVGTVETEEIEVAPPPEAVPA
jgi:hypothetical protein